MGFRRWGWFPGGGDGSQYNTSTIVGVRGVPLRDIWSLRMLVGGWAGWDCSAVVVVVAAAVALGLGPYGPKTHKTPFGAPEIPGYVSENGSPIHSHEKLLFPMGPGPMGPGPTGPMGP